MLMKLDDKTASGRPLNNYEDSAAELERIAERVRNAPELSHHAAERLPKVAQDIRSDLDHVGGVIL
jgi:hypothetical protein